MKIEKELRFYFPTEKLAELRKKLSNYEERGRYREITIMYDNPNPEYSFYSKAVDGRLRLRFSKLMSGQGRDDKCLITWKRRINSLGSNVREEEEIEYDVPANQFEAVKEVFENVLRCPRISSYERYRNYYSTRDIDITLDEFPFGLMFELELKQNQNDELLLEEEAKRLGLSVKAASKLSCDDKYSELCEKTGLQPKSDILFSDKDMPTIALKPDYKERGLS